MKKVPLYKYLYGLLDFFVVSSSFLVAAYIVSRNYDVHIVDYLITSSDSLLILFFFSVVFLFIFDFNDLYKINVILSRAVHLTSLIKSYFYGIFLVILTAYASKSSALLDSRLLVLAFAIFSLPVFYLIRIELFRAIFKKIKSTRFRRNVIIIGDGKSGQLLAAKLHVENSIGIDVKGFVIDGTTGEDHISGKKVLGHISDLQLLISRHNIHEIIIAVDRIDYAHLLHLLDTCHNLEVAIRVSSDMFRIVHEKISTEKYVDIPVIDINPRYNTLISSALKRAVDLVISAAAMILLIPFFIVTGILIKLSSPGPVFFVQKRIGKNGKPFNFYKFRSMYNLNNEDIVRKEKMIEFMRNAKDRGTDTKVVDESRITSIGKFLRKTSLDELPQLINVLKGDMSLVGPRPCLPYEYENYDDWQKRRLDVLPGCTGVWQTSGRSSVSFIDSIVLDLYYINNMSPWLDLQLILKTIPVMLFARGGK